MKPYVAVGFDNVLADYLTALVAWYSETQKKELQTEAMSTYDIMSLIGENKDEVNAKLSEFHKSSWFNKKLRPLKQALESLKSLRKFFHFAIVCSHPCELEASIRGWADRHFSGMFQKALFSTSPTEETQRSFKVMCEQVGAVALIDANPDNIIACDGLIKRSILFGHYPWSQVERSDKPLPEQTIVVADWESARAELEKFANSEELVADLNPASGPKLSRFLENTVTVSSRRPASYYATLGVAKLKVHNSIELIGVESSIAVCVQVAEVIKQREGTDLKKIRTDYTMTKGRRGRSGGYNTPIINITLAKSV